MPKGEETSNVSEFSVSEISQAVKRTVEDAFGYVRVRGEISGFRGQHGSGHAYFALKDEKARIEAVIWRGVFNRLKVKPEEGLEVIATGKVTTYPGSSKYQIVIEALEPAGVGALMALLEERKKKLSAEGLFEPARKQLLPFLPRVIGVVTSPTGAVIRDILHRLQDRFPSKVLLWPVRVQGETSGDEVAAAVRGFNIFDGSNGLETPDIIIVARGGGSLEDLWGFNDEAVVRAVAESDIPVISAVGHETDWTLIDYAADVRAPTPTGAAEMAVPVRLDLLTSVDDLDKRNRGAVLRNLSNQKTILAGLSRALPNREQLLSLHRQRLDEVAGRLPRAMDAKVRDVKNRVITVRAKHSLRTLTQGVEVLSGRLNVVSNRLKSGLQNRTVRERKRLSDITARLNLDSLQFKVSDRRQRLMSLSDRRNLAIERTIERKKTALNQSAALLKLVSYQGVLDRGFALVRDEKGNPIRSVASVEEGTRYQVQFADGDTTMVRDSSTAPSTPLKKQAKRSPKSTILPKSDKQGSLF